jgi:hypothetical protein
MVTVLLLLAGAACFLLAAFNAVTKPNLIGLGLLCWILPTLVDAVQAVT